MVQHSDALEIEVTSILHGRASALLPTEARALGKGGFTDARAISDLMTEAYGMKHEDFLIKEATSSLSLKDARPMPD